MIDIKSNIQKVEKDWEYIKNNFGKIITDGLSHIGFIITSMIDKSLAKGTYGVKTDTGRLRGGLNSRVSNNILTIGDNVRYAKIQEYGGPLSGQERKEAFFNYKKTGNIKAKYSAMSGKIKPHYFMHRSINDNTNKWVNAFGKFIMSRIK